MTQQAFVWPETPWQRPVPELLVTVPAPGVRGLSRRGRVRCQYVLRRGKCQCRRYGSTVVHGVAYCTTHAGK